MLRIEGIGDVRVMWGAYIKLFLLVSVYR